MRLLLDGLTGRASSDEPLTDEDIAALYAAPDLPWLRVNMVSTVDGAATGEGGKSGGINNPPDKRVFHALRALCDVIVVGAGTARIEGYRPAVKPLVLVSRRGELPESLKGAPEGSVLMATYAASPGLPSMRDQLGEDHVIVAGESDVEPLALKAALADRGWHHQLSEGGPTLLHAMLAAGAVDEVTATFVPMVVGGDHIRMTAGPPLDVPLSLGVLLEEDGTLLGRWLTRDR